MDNNIKKRKLVIVHSKNNNNNTNIIKLKRKNDDEIINNLNLNLVDESKRKIKKIYNDDDDDDDDDDNSNSNNNNNNSDNENESESEGDQDNNENDESRSNSNSSNIQEEEEEDEIEDDMEDEDDDEENDDYFVNNKTTNDKSIEIILGWKEGEIKEEKIVIENGIEVKKEFTRKCNYYYVKYNNYSYLHCEWLSENEIINRNKYSKVRLRKAHERYLLPYVSTNTHDHNNNSIEIDMFNSDYIEVDRIISFRVVNKKKQYLVKWRSLGYTDCTWEDGDFINEDAHILLFEKRNLLPTNYTEIINMNKVDVRKGTYEKALTSPQYKHNNQLREYQLEGYNWMVFNYHQHRNCLLADEMGLGNIYNIYK